ncbi:LOW QUALITY PROTEIN: melanoma-associated antigen B1-like [Echinops telfairi]|uniref:LOW QUALITY PROTEIN: melanoma-associated antigen B1-like n=1 Tax=Echinops telfairi TaxID=9371 RepID=A0AC55D424_ECHTE|nr:LOW QUALITY PROTEIN: melanoma-associated antigen B1-like [Echinops telfairi]
MPHSQKSKRHVHEKRQQAQGQSQAAQGAQATAGEEEGPSSSSHLLGDPTKSFPVKGVLREAKEATAPASAVLSRRSDVDAKGQEEKSPSPAQGPSATEKPKRDLLTRKAGLLVLFLIGKYKIKKPILKVDMLKAVNRKFQKHFSEILWGVAERMELVFGLELKEANPSGTFYHLISQLDITGGGTFSGGMELPKAGLVMALFLGVIFMNGNQATGEEILEFLDVLGISAGKRHLIFGEPRKFLTNDLVWEKFLEYQQVPNSDPPCYKYLSGPRAHADTTKMKVLEALAKINDTVPSAFPPLYEEAWRDEEETAFARMTVRARTHCTASASSMALSGSRSPF